MTTTTDPLTAPDTADLETFVRLGVAGDGVSLHWRVTLPVELEAARRILETAGPYNAFDPGEAFDLVVSFADHVSSVELAREYSMALYFTLPHWRHQTISAPREPGQWLTPADEDRVPDHETRNTTTILERNLIDMGASEISWFGHRTHGHGHGMVVRSPIYDAERMPPTSIPDDVRPYQVRGWWD